MAGKISKVQNAKAKPQFDPKKNYRWEPDDVFEMSGLDFSTIYNTLKEAVLKPGGTPAINLVASFNLATALLAKGVEEGIINEIPEEQPPVKTEAPAKKSSKKKTETEPEQ